MRGDLKSAMGALNFYSMEAGTLAAGEVAAYESAIGWLDNYFRELSAELFPETAESYGLSFWEQALGITDESETTGERRERIVEKESQEPGNFIGYLFLRQLAEKFPSAAISRKANNVSITGIDRTDMSRLRLLAELVLPNLSPRADIALDGAGKSWNTWENEDCNWNFYDRAALPWGFYDTI